MMYEFFIETPKHKLKVEAHYKIVNKNAVKVDKKFFENKCKTCRNYNKKYSCPPLSPEFNSYVDCDKLLVLMLKMNLNQLDGFDYNEFHKIRIGNAILKPKIEKIMRELGGGSKFLSSGACRLCKPCQLTLKKPCKHPDKRRYSLESLGVNCDALSKDLFGTPLLWYKDKKASEYTLVICALPVKDNNTLEDIKRLIIG